MAKKWLQRSWDWIRKLVQPHRPFSRRLAESSIEYFDQKFIKTAIRCSLPEGWLIVAYMPTGKNSGKHWAYKIYHNKRLQSFGVTHLKLKTKQNRGLVTRPQVNELEKLLLSTLKLYRFNSVSPVLYGTVVLNI